MKETDNNRGSILDSLVKLILIAAIIAATIFLGIKTHEIYKNKMLEKSLKTAHSIEEVAELINCILSESSPDSISQPPQDLSSPLRSPKTIKSGTK